MKCRNAKICNKINISSAVTVTGTNLVVNIPSGVFPNCYTGCLVLAQNIPDTATVNMPVVITIGEDTTEYPLLNTNGAPVVASRLSTRTRYPFRVSTTQTSANFILLCGVPCNVNNLPGIPVSTTTVGG